MTGKLPFVLIGLVALAIPGCGSDDHAVDGGSRDLTSTSYDAPAPRDLSIPGALVCGQLLDCANAATSEVALGDCISRGLPTGRALFFSLRNCVSSFCGTSDGGAPAEAVDGGTNACGTFDTCSSCVQTGAGSMQANGMCAAVDAGPTVTDPRCGRCVDQLLACTADR